jgi:hypothetical protein
MGKVEEAADADADDSARLPRYNTAWLWRHFREKPATFMFMCVVPCNLFDYECTEGIYTFMFSVNTNMEARGFC